MSHAKSMKATNLEHALMPSVISIFHGTGPRACRSRKSAQYTTGSRD